MAPPASCRNSRSVEDRNPERYDLSARSGPFRVRERRREHARRLDGDADPIHLVIAAIASPSVMVIEADALDIIPGSGLMTQVALAHVGVLPASDLHRDHAEMPHEVARRRLVALRAVPGTGRGMSELRQCPLRNRVALGTVGPELALVTILGFVAGDALQRGFSCAQVRIHRRPSGP